MHIEYAYVNIWVSSLQYNFFLLSLGKPKKKELFCGLPKLIDDIPGGKGRFLRTGRLELKRVIFLTVCPRSVVHFIKCVLYEN